MKAKNAHQKKLNKIFNDSISNPNTVIVVSSDSIKNNVTTSILHVYNGWNIIAKTIHYTMNITFTEMELFSIRCEINQAVQVSNIEQIIVITDTIPAARYIFNLFTYPYQLHSISVFQDLIKILEPSLTRTLIILFCFEISLTVINGLFIWQLT